MSNNGLGTVPPPSAGSTSQPRLNVTVTVLGAICGAVVPACLSALDAPTSDKLFGLVVGAALPPFVSTIGSWRRIRVGVALLLTSISLVIAYGGLTVGAVAVAATPPLPVPGLTKPPPASTTPPTPPPTDPTPPSLPPPTAPDGRPHAGIVVSPSTVACDAAGCGTVTVTSNGTAALEIGRIEFRGADAESATASGCQETKLDPGDGCTISITIDRRSIIESTSITMVINQNVEGPPTTVEVAIGGKPNLALGPVLSCLRRGNTLAVAAPLRHEGTVVRSDVGATLSVNGRPIRSQRVRVGSDQVGFTVIDARLLAAGGLVAVELDPQHQIDESDEKDNRVTCTLPAASLPNLAVSSRTASCELRGSTLVITMPMSVSGKFPVATVTAAVGLDGRPARQLPVAVNADRLRFSIVDRFFAIRPPSAVAIDVDSRQQIDESNEKDNRAICAVRKVS
jgi:hypothetical protein